MKVWVTRAEPGASNTAARLRSLGCEPVVGPLLAIRSLPFKPPAEVAALAFTSANGVRALAGRLDAEAWRKLPAFTVGDATAATARAAGFEDVRSAEGDATALSRLLETAGPGLTGPVLHLRAREPAAELTPAGVQLVPISAYEAVDQPLPEAVRAVWMALTAVLIHSPRAARVLLRATQSLPVHQLRAACISEAAAVPLQGRLGAIVVAEHPTENGVLAALGKALGPS